MAVAVPNGIVLLLLGWLFIIVALRANDVDTIPDVLFKRQQVCNDRQPPRGKAGLRCHTQHTCTLAQFHIFHYICLFVSLATIVLWCTLSFTRHIFGDMGFIALFPLVMFLSTGVLTKHDFRERFAWDLVCAAKRAPVRSMLGGDQCKT